MKKLVLSRRANRNHFFWNYENNLSCRRMDKKHFFLKLRKHLSCLIEAIYTRTKRILQEHSWQVFSTSVSCKDNIFSYLLWELIKMMTLLFTSLKNSNCRYRSFVPGIQKWYPSESSDSQDSKTGQNLQQITLVVKIVIRRTSGKHMGGPRHPPIMSSARRLSSLISMADLRFFRKKLNALTFLQG